VKLTLDVLRVQQTLDVRTKQESTVLTVEIFGEEVTIPVTSHVMERLVTASVAPSVEEEVPVAGPVAKESAPSAPAEFAPPVVSPQMLRERARSPRKSNVDESGFEQG
jgi:hypothetical protein